VTDQATRPDGMKRWHVHTSVQPEGDYGSPVKAVWKETAGEARMVAERLGYTVERVEPAPPARW